MASAQNYLAQHQTVDFNPDELKVRQKDDAKMFADQPHMADIIYPRQGDIVFVDSNGQGITEFSGVSFERIHSMALAGAAEASLTGRKHPKVTTTCGGGASVNLNGDDELRQGQIAYAVVQSNPPTGEYVAVGRSSEDKVAFITANPDLHVSDNWNVVGKAVKDALKREKLPDSFQRAIEGAFRVMDDDEYTDDAEGRKKRREERRRAVRFVRHLRKNLKRQGGNRRVFKLGRVLKGGYPGQQIEINMAV
jgi:hypothetical protein